MTVFTNALMMILVLQNSPALLAPTEVPKEVVRIVDDAPTSDTASSSCSVAAASRGSARGGTAETPAPAVLPTQPGEKQPVRIGENAQTGNLILHPSPAYPLLARTARIEGCLLLQVVIATDGTIQEVKVVGASSPLLLPGVIDTVKTWTYKPTLLNGAPVKVQTQITINFNLANPTPAPGQ